MNKKAILAAALAAQSVMAGAQLPSGYSASPWHGGRQCAITYSFDDLCANQIPVALPILEKYGMRATLNIVADWVKPEQWAQVADAARRGHEIAGHTMSHPNLAELTEQQFEQEQAGCKRILEEKTGAKVVTMVYPFCVSAREEITEKYYMSARICDGRIEPQTPAQMLRLSSRGVGPMYNFSTGREFSEWVQQGAREKGWCTFLIHGIDGDGGYSAIKSQELEEHLKYVSDNAQMYWVATFAQVSKYIIERDALTVKEISAGKKQIRLEAGCAAKSEITALDEPVTIARELPSGWAKAAVMEDGKAVASEISDGKVVFDVVPGRRYVIVRKK